MKKQPNKQIRTYSHTKKHQISEQTLNNNIQKPLKNMTEGTMTGMLSQYLCFTSIVFVKNPAPAAPCCACNGLLFRVRLGVCGETQDVLGELKRASVKLGQTLAMEKPWGFHGVNIDSWDMKITKWRDKAKNHIGI
jgi:hypothetical protein